MALLPPGLTENYKNRTMHSPVLQGILVLIVLVVFSWFVLRPRLATFNQTRAEVKVAQQQLSKIASDQNDLNRLINEMRSSPDDVKIADEALPLSDRASKINVLVDSLVRSSGMTLASLTVKDAQEVLSAGDKAVLKDPYQPGRALHTITISASLTGTMEQLKNLLQLIETNGRVLDVQSLKITNDNPNNFILTVKAYSYEGVAK